LSRSPASSWLSDVRAHRRSQSNNTPSVTQALLYIVFQAGRDHMELFSTSSISSPNGNIEKLPVPLGSHISSPQGRGTRRGCC
ncbi:hypothetical protein AVEN_212011-1, partial [Araneus ventricosus]